VTGLAVGGQMALLNRCADGASHETHNQTVGHLPVHDRLHECSRLEGAQREFHACRADECRAFREIRGRGQCCQDLFWSARGDSDGKGNEEVWE
jgi:hypothetical protein